MSELLPCLSDITLNLEKLRVLAICLFFFFFLHRTGLTVCLFLCVFFSANKKQGWRNYGENSAFPSFVSRLKIKSTKTIEWI